mgnify:CR=1 FL=1
MLNGDNAVTSVWQYNGLHKRGVPMKWGEEKIKGVLFQKGNCGWHRYEAGGGFSYAAGEGKETLGYDRATRKHFLK